MDLHVVAEKVGTVEGLDGIAKPAAEAVKKVIGRGALKDLLSGSWLGHSLHPLLTDIPIGSFTSATVLDLLAGKKGRDSADLLVALGILSAVPTAAAGLADWSDTYGPDQRMGVAHAAANAVGLGLYGLSLVHRRRGNRKTGVTLGLLGMGVMSVGGYFGGHLSYSRGIGVNHTFTEEQPDDWTPVIEEASLTDGKPVRVDADGASVLVYRQDGRILALASRCTHAGGPLDEGEIDRRACTVTCPWHQSEFRLEDGHVVHGPATVPQPAYEVRVSGGKVEVRRPH